MFERVKNCLTIGQDKLSSLSIFAIEHELPRDCYRKSNWIVCKQKMWHKCLETFNYKVIVPHKIVIFLQLSFVIYLNIRGKEVYEMVRNKFFL